MIRSDRGRQGPGKFSMALSTEDLELHGRSGLYDLQAPTGTGGLCTTDERSRNNRAIAIEP